MKPIDLIDLQIRLEYQVNENGRLVPHDGSSEQALYIIYRHTDGLIPYLNHLLPSNLSESLSELGEAEGFHHPEMVRSLITDMYRPCTGGDEVFWSGYFAKSPGANEYHDVTSEGQACVVKKQGQIISRATSIRQNEHCAEVFVETDSRFRQKGFGRQVVAAWANQVMSHGQVALYSYKVSNIASARLAISLGVDWFADVIAFE